MPDDLPGAVADSPQPDASPAPSAEPQPVPDQPSQPGPAPSTPADSTRNFNLPPEERWNQLRAERQEAMQRAERAEAMARMALEKFQASPQQTIQANDPWEGKVNHPDPQTALFYQEQRRLFQVEAERAADQKLQGVMQAVNAGRQELASIKVAQFRKENPDIKPGSPEESAIATFVQQGHDIDTAKKLALYDTLEAENRAFKSKHASVGQKVAANVTAPTAGIPSTAGLPGKPGDWREKVRESFRKGGGLADIVNAAGATRDSPD